MMIKHFYTLYYHITISHCLWQCLGRLPPIHVPSASDSLFWFTFQFTFFIYFFDSLFESPIWFTCWFAYMIHFFDLFFHCISFSLSTFIVDSVNCLNVNCQIQFIKFFVKFIPSNSFMILTYQISIRYICQMHFFGGCYWLM